MDQVISMDDVLEELASLTQSFVSDLDGVTSDQVEVFVDKRQVVVERLMDMAGSHKMNAEQQDRLRNILSYDESIQAHMLSLKNEAQKWLVQRNAARNQRSVYEAKYAADSYLMDKRK